MKANALLAVFMLFSSASADPGKPVIHVGSKIFTESYVLAEIAAQLIEQVGEARVDRKFGMGGTGIVAQALENGSIDVYPEYTGTIAETLLKDCESCTARGHLTAADIATRLAKRNGPKLVLSRSLGFNNTYALALRGEYARDHRLSRISDLAREPGIHAGFSHEFLERPDGYPGLKARYGLALSQIDAISHSLAYDALAGGKIEVTDVYSTDAKIEKLGLRVLEDDQHFFRDYEGVWLARAELAVRFPKTWAALRGLESRIDNHKMIELNARADLERSEFPEIARRFLQSGARPLVPAAASSADPGSDPAPHSAPAWRARVWTRTLEHLELVFISLFCAVLVGLPLGIAALRLRWVRQPILLISGMLQTIPSLALLCFLIPVFGIGTLPALVALFLYALLPIVANTYTGLAQLDPKLLESARALGLSSWQRLRLIELPLASTSILTGIRTSAIISVGTATLAALIGAGGYGAPIVTGLALNDLRLILEGAIPAALLSLVMQGLFELLEAWLVPRSLRSS